MTATNEHIDFYQHLPTFLRELENLGFIREPGQWVAISKILENLGSSDELQYSLAPIVCKTPGQQEAFYQIFDDWFGTIILKGDDLPEKIKKSSTNTPLIEPLKPEEEVPQSFKRRDLLIVLSGIVFIIVVMVLFRLSLGDGGGGTNVTKNPVPIINRENIFSDISKTISDHPNYFTAGSFLFLLIILGLIPSVKKLMISFFNENLRISLKYKIPERFRRPKDEDSFDSTIAFKKTKELNSYIPTQKPLKEDQKDLKPYLLGYAWLYIIVFVPWTLVDFLRGFYWSYILLFSLSLIIIGLLFYLKKPPKISVQHEHTAQGDVFWDFRLPHRRILFGTEFKALSRRLRERVHSVVEHLDVPKTVKLSAKANGFFSPQYRLGAEIPTCLMLIDRSNDNNHRAALFDAFYQYLNDNEVPVVRYFFRTVPQILWNEDHPHGVSLETLAGRYADSRLFFLGDGWRLLDPLTSEPDTNSQSFFLWKDRVLITPIPFPQWTGRERDLESLFVIAPFTTEGLKVIERHFNPEEPFNWELQRPSHWGEESILFDETKLPNSLSPFFPEPAMLEWLAALSFYPVLNWELTLFLGDLLTKIHNKPLLTFENLRRLSRIYWFYNGFIPPKAREALYKILDTEKAKIIHFNIAKLLLEQLPHKEDYYSAERDQLRLQILLHKALAGQASEAEVKELHSLIKNEEQDFLIARFINNPKPWEWVMPQEFAFLVSRGKGVIAWLNGLFPSNVIVSTQQKTIEEQKIKAEKQDQEDALMESKKQESYINEPIEYLLKDNTLVEMIVVIGGAFHMGDEYGDLWKDSQPLHQEAISNFAIGKYPVTNGQFIHFLNEKGNQADGGVEWINLSGNFWLEKCRIRISGDGQFSVESGYEDHPVNYVSWYGAKAFTRWFSEKTRKKYRLPSEAEWEYAARGGSSSKAFKFSGSNNSSEVSWSIENSEDHSWPVGLNKPNELGLFDMSGNVWEWCEDQYDSYDSVPLTNGHGTQRVHRGGSWLSPAQFCRIADRGRADSTERRSNIGFRIASSIK